MRKASDNSDKETGEETASENHDEEDSIDTNFFNKTDDGMCDWGLIGCAEPLTESRQTQQSFYTHTKTTPTSPGTTSITYRPLYGAFNGSHIKFGNASFAQTSEESKAPKEVTEDEKDDDGETLYAAKTSEEATIPRRATAGSVAFDLFAIGSATIPKGEAFRAIDTGIILGLPRGMGGDSSNHDQDTH